MKFKKSLLIGFTTLSLIGLASCGGGESSSSSVSSTTTTTPTTELTDSEIYDKVLKEFYTAYSEALDTDILDERYAKMAIAEAKLLESGVILPTTTQGGLYSLSRVAPYTFDYAKAGNDSDRFHQALVTKEIIKVQDRITMKNKWEELKGSGNYISWAKNYLETHNYTLEDTYNISYSSNPKTWDVLATSLSADSNAIINTYDGLVEYDVEGVLKPALADSWTISDDGLTYTFKIRQGVKWVDSQGRELSEVTADDFVAGFQHMLDAKGGLEYLVDGLIAGVSEYLETQDNFEAVGVKAIDNYTLEYTLTEKTSYFVSMLGYGVFAPMNRAFYESLGGKFGSSYDSASSDYKYGKSEDTIAYCGPYLVSNNTANSMISYTLNPLYWNKDNINVKNINWYFNDGTDVTKSYTDFKAGTIDVCSLSSSTIETAKAEGLFDDYSYISSTTTTTFMTFYNVNRKAYSNSNDNSLTSSKTESERIATNKALQNQNFRLALSYATNRILYNAQKVGDSLATTSLRNTYTPGDFVRLSEDTQVLINGEEVLFKKGTYYGEIIQAQIDKDGYQIKVWDENMNDGLGSSDGFDGWHNVENAKSHLDKAIEELKDLNISKTNPIKIDYPYFSNSSVYTNVANAYKKSIEEALEGKVIINLVACTSQSEWLNAGYTTTLGSEANYDMYDLSGWGPDYLDPSTYLDTFLPDGNGFMTKCIGLF